MTEKARNSSKKISILGFIDRLDGIYEATYPFPQILDLLLDYTLGNEVQVQRLDIFREWGLHYNTEIGKKLAGDLFSKNLPFFDRPNDSSLS
jgi:hypothetical protein